MNYLAHAYLSFNNPEILAGNMISDFIKGRKKFDYSAGIQQGITLHRAIDTFTDAHPVTKQAKLLFKPAYGLYAGAFMDVVYDHFLALDPTRFSNESLLDFSLKTYARLQPFENVFPERSKKFFHYMRVQNWLYHYRGEEGIENSFKGLVSRAVFLSDHRPALLIFKEHYPELNGHYHAFFPQLFAFSYEMFNKLLSR